MKAKTGIKCYTCEEPLTEETVFYDEDNFGREPFCEECHEANVRHDEELKRGVIAHCGHCGCELMSGDEEHFTPGGCINKQPVVQAGICANCGRPWVDGKCSGGFVNHKL